MRNDSFSKNGSLALSSATNYYNMNNLNNFEKSENLIRRGSGNAQGN